jgi:hypothetical protein
MSAIIAGMTADVTGFIAYDCAIDRGPLPCDFVHATNRRQGLTSGLDFPRR